MPRLTFLGTGNAFSSGGRGNQCLLLDTGSARWLIDCGPTSILQAHRFGVDLASIDGLCLTHLHADHALGAPMLLLGLNFLYPPTRPFPVVGPPGTRDYLEAAFRLAYPDVAARGVGYTLDVHELDGEASQAHAVDGITFGSVAMRHSVPVNGYRITVGGKLLAVSGDTGPEGDLERLGEGADVFVVECNTVAPLPRVSHMAAEDHRGRMPYGARRVAFVHVGPDVQAERAVIEAELDAEIPDDGDSWQL
jgi:ribonuclease BN (tRNA processing enzyme)